MSEPAAHQVRHRLGHLAYRRSLTLTKVRKPARTAFVAIAALTLAACSTRDNSSTMTATPVSRLTSASHAAARTSGAFPTAPAHLPTRAKDGTVYPGTAWQHVRPSALGFNGKRLRAIARAAKPSATTCLLVARKGKVVGEWNWQDVTPDTPREVFSVTKSVTSTLVGMAQADGDLRVSQPASHYIAEWWGTKSGGVTIRDILGNDSGRHWDFNTDYGDLPNAQDRTQFAIDLGQQYPPGKVWAYNNAAIQTLDRVVSTATGQTTRAYAASRLFGPIGMTHTEMTADPVGNTNTFFGVQTTCEDLARFGYLFLRHGRWGDHQVVPRAWVKAAVGAPSQQHNAAYGLLWWLNRRGPLIGPLNTDAPGQPTPPIGQEIPGAPADMFSAQGLGGQVVLVDPGSQTVVVRIGQFTPSGADQYSARDAARFVTEALRR
jgi:CubicO group peptidase (beta-lactamase class C family)